MSDVPTHNNVSDGRPSSAPAGREVKLLCEVSLTMVQQAANMGYRM